MYSKEQIATKRTFAKKEKQFVSYTSNKIKSTLNGIEKIQVLISVGTYKIVCKALL